jgi:UDP-glucuronate decarboxylase
MTGSQSEIVHRPLPVDDPRRRRPDIRLAKVALDWEPKVSLREGLARTIAYFDSEMSAGRHNELAKIQST